VKIFTDFVTKLYFFNKTELDIYAYVEKEELCAVTTWCSKWKDNK